MIGMPIGMVLSRVEERGANKGKNSSCINLGFAGGPVRGGFFCSGVETNQ